MSDESRSLIRLLMFWCYAGSLVAIVYAGYSGQMWSLVFATTLAVVASLIGIADALIHER